jgi:PAS domain S-box-containing protein
MGGQGRQQKGEIEPSPIPVVGEGDALYRALFDINTAVKLLIDPNTQRIVDANQAAVALYGWSKEELKQKKISQINTLSESEVKAEIENARTGRRRYFRFRHRTARGAELSVEVHSGPVVIDGQQLLLSIIFDVTERDAFEEQLRASQRLEAVGRLAGGVAHDFNNLLTVVQGAAELISRGVPEESPLRAHVSDLVFATGRAAELTRSLLAFSGRQPMRREAMSLNDVVGSMTGLLSRTLAPQIQVHAKLAPDVPPVMADPTQIERVVMNLAINGRDAMPGGGRLLLETGTKRIVDLDTSSVPIGDWVTLSVSDEGHGMDAETIAHVFEPFFSTKEASAGGGLGLATVHGIVTQTGGHIVVTSAPTEGTCFTIYLPPATTE